ncbi:MAG: molybdopterin oxidoreductase family protein, partial [Rhodovibrionaceae bacterium]
MPLDAQTKPETVYSVCPHDCPSTCALEVERLSETRIGKVRGLKGHPYTDGVICAKVARYAERVHHPDRLIQPLQRVGEKGGG